ncbi:hypothetical protein [Streptomyces tubercidicus]|uniref:hypothetical protein n=1 Tax=Streptomyces tubercidicus TaxID=47759 RepID=UPI0034678717
MSRYLEEAAEQLRKSAATNEKKNNRDGREKELNEGRERIARQFATLAAIDKDLLPGDVVQDVLRAITDRAA